MDLASAKRTGQEYSVTFIQNVIRYVTLENVLVQVKLYATVALSMLIAMTLGSVNVIMNGQGMRAQSTLAIVTPNVRRV